MPCFLACLWTWCSLHHRKFCRMAFENFGEAAVVELHAAKGAEIKCSISNPRLQVRICRCMQYSKRCVLHRLAFIILILCDTMWYYVVHTNMLCRYNGIQSVQFCRLSCLTMQGLFASYVYLVLSLYFCAHLEPYGFTVHSRYSTVQNWCAPKQPYLLHKGRTVSGTDKRSRVKETTVATDQDQAPPD